MICTNARRLQRKGPYGGVGDTYTEFISAEDTLGPKKELLKRETMCKFVSGPVRASISLALTHILSAVEQDRQARAVLHVARSDGTICYESKMHLITYSVSRALAAAAPLCHYGRESQ